MKIIQNVSASRLQKILNRSRELNTPYEMLLRRYAFDRFLKRMTVAGYERRLILKGALALNAYSETPTRPSKDIDFLGEGITALNVLPIMSEIAQAELAQDDGIIFDVASFRAEPIQAKKEESGVRVTGVAKMGNVKIPLKIEVSFGHVVTPEPNFIKIPTLLDDGEEIRISAYTRETILAEKFEAMVSLGFGNSRIKDFFDIRVLKRTQYLSGDIATAALKNTFKKRETEIPKEYPIAFSEEFIKTVGDAQWKGFISKLGIRDKSSFAEVVAEIAPMCMGFADMANDLRPVEDWHPDLGFDGSQNNFSL